MPPTVGLDVTGSSPGKPSKILPRNIDKVILGDIEFDTWFHSPYPDSLIFSANAASAYHDANGLQVNGIAKGQVPPNASWKSAVCPVLHVCPYCFAYSPSVEPYIAHLKHHRKQQKEDPEWSPVPGSAEKVYEFEGYAVHKIDGQREKLYCQNLSLFGKLFLEQKSVFFDTSGFWYHVLAYTPPSDSHSQREGAVRKKANIGRAEELGLGTQILGFFSKEKISWDQNNLACILVFPPFQHRQLGKLLMAVSYKLSGWEWMGEENCAIGGPEKPLSVMGRNSYLRFWSERIARYIMGQSGDSDGKRVFQSNTSKLSVVKKKGQRPEKETFTVKDIGERTGMLAEDVMAALMEMNIWEMADPPKPIKKSEQANGIGPDQLEGVNVEKMMVVKRSKILDWAHLNGVELEDPVKEEGFIGEWATYDEGYEEAVDEDV